MLLNSACLPAALHLCCSHLSEQKPPLLAACGCLQHAGEEYHQQCLQPVASPANTAGFTITREHTHPVFVLVCLCCPFPDKLLECFNLLLLMLYLVLQALDPADVVSVFSCICTAVLPLFLFTGFRFSFEFCNTSLQLLGLASALL